MTLHEKAIKGLLKDEVLTTEMLNEKDESGYTVWHAAATANALKDIPSHLFTSDALAQKLESEETVWHMAAWFNTLRDIPVHLFNKEALIQKDEDKNTVFHKAAYGYTFKDIPEHLFTTDALSQINNEGDTVWHLAVIQNNIKDINHDCFSHEALELKDKYGYSVWSSIACKGDIKKLPLHVISKELLTMKDQHGCILFTGSKKYINRVISSRSAILNTFIENNPNHAKDLELKDSRLILRDVNKEELVFMFKGIDDKVIVKKDGVFIKNENLNSLGNAVLFIENNYENIERSLVLPSSRNIKIGDLSL